MLGQRREIRDKTKFVQEFNVNYKSRTALAIPPWLGHV